MVPFESEVPAPDAPDREAGRRTILIVDDESINLYVLHNILQKAGFAVLEADNGLDARRLAEQERPDLILLDVMMPGESGLQTCARLKENPGTARIPVIFLSCLGELSNKVAGLEAGAVDYVTKPFHAAEILARVRSHIAQAVSREALIVAQAGRLSQVREAQHSMLVRPEDLPEARFGVDFRTVLEAGGDFYDVVALPGGRFGYLVADVSGHDLGASFVTSSLKALFRQGAASFTSPAGLLETVNKVLKAITREDIFLTACCAVVDRRAGTVSLATAGHPPAILAPRRDEPRTVGGRGDILGVFDRVEVETEELAVSSGDRLFLFTDGLLEKIPGRADSIPQSLERLVRACAEHPEMPIAETVGRLSSELLGRRELLDDAVILGVEV